MTAQEVKTSDWYKGIIEEIDSIRVETVYQAQSQLIQGKYDIGKVIFEQKHLGVTELVQYLSLDLKISERELWYCAKFYEDHSRLMKIAEFADNKAISWNKVKKLLTTPTDGKTKKPCLHGHVIMIKICDDCGAKIKEED